VELVKKLIEVQHDLKAPKGQTNTFGKYKYRSAEDILEAVKPLNAKVGLLLTLSDEPIFIGEWHYIKATATITDGKDSHVVTAYARESETKKGMDDSQITGTASSYARKYALNGLYLIDDTKDADSEEYQKQTTSGNQPSQSKPYTPPSKPQQQQQPSGPKMVSPAQIKAIGTKTSIIAKTNGQDQTTVYQSVQKHLGISKSTRELTASEASKFIEYLTTLE